MMIFLHGFNSAGGSMKGRWFRKTFDEYQVLLPTLFYEPRRAIGQVEALINEYHTSHDSAVLVGSSLGGFYAPYLAKQFGLPSILINPLVDHTLLREAIGPQENFYTEEHYDWTAAYCDQLDELTVNPADLEIPPLVLLDEADETLDSKLAARHFQNRALVRVFPGGSHRFDHLEEALPIIRNYLSQHGHSSQPE